MTARTYEFVQLDVTTRTKRPVCPPAYALRTRLLCLRDAFVEQRDELQVARVIPQPVQVRVVLDLVSPERASAANHSLQQIESRVIFSEMTVDARNVVYCYRVFLLDGLSPRRPVFRPVLLT